MIQKLAYTLLLVLVVLIACASAPAPEIPPQKEGPLPRHAVRISAIPPDYAIWYGEVKECAGFSRVEFEQIKWYAVIVPDVRGWRWPPPPNDSLWVAGLAYHSLNVIVMGNRWLLSAPEIRHELMHLIASPTGHDAELYQRKCSHLVTCVAACLSDTLSTR